MGKIRTGIGVLRERGVKYFLKRMIGYVYRHTIRKLLPKTGSCLCNGVIVGNKKLFDEFLPREFHFREDQPRWEGGIVSLHEEYTKDGDSVVIIGGGRGVSATVAATNVGPSGDVTIYEGSRNFVDFIYKTIDLNNIEAPYSVIHGVVGEGESVWGSSEEAKQVDPSHLPNCDVLEMDCEGSETDILKKLHIRPRVIIVELHPGLYPEQADFPLQKLEELGYQVVQRTGHYGTSVSEKKSEIILRNMEEGTQAKREVDADPPLVIGAIRSDTA